MKDQREKIIVKTSAISILANFVLAGFKALVGLLAHSIAVISDAVNNFTDALSSIITIIGTKLAGKAPDKKHPYGHGRVEYVTTFIVAGLVLYAGITALVESIKKMIHPEAADYSVITLVILIVAIVIKFILGIYVKYKGKKVKSDSLVASGSDAFNDAILSISVLASAVIYLVFKVSLEAYVGLILSCFIIKTGVELIKTAVNNLIGVRVESHLARAIKKEIIKEKSIQGAYDLVLNDYGPDKYLGSVHIEVADMLTVAEIDKLSRQITKNIAEKYGVFLHTIGVYSINTQDQSVIETKKQITKIVFAHAGVLQMHGFYLDESSKTISFDIILDFNLKDREAVYRAIYDKVQNQFPAYKIEITLDVDVSD
ncbi:MAG: cation transporter [Clostridia bacterium]|nr:cation transporter [Clostridia bacterium]